MQYPLVTVVGGSGFLGRHTVRALAKAGYRVRVLCRNPTAAEFLKTAATIGQIAIQYADITRPETLAGKFDGSTAVVNLVSILHESGRQKFARINVAGARAITEQARAAGAQQFVQVSALGVNAATDSKYGTTKLAGEKAVRDIFPHATILRPGLIIGPEDSFFQRFARMRLLLPFLPVIGGGKTRFQPVLVTDVAAGIVAALTRPDAHGKTFELGGPETFTFRQLLEMLGRVTHRPAHLISIPFSMASLQGAMFELLPFAPPITRDQVRLLKHDSVVQPGALTFSHLGLIPDAIEAALPVYLARFIKE